VTTSAPPNPADRHPGSRDGRVALAIVTSAFSAMLLSANLATPLYAVWARQFGFSTAVLALIFAVYALVLIPALLVFGQLSDRLGRRVVIAIGLCIAIVALVLFALATATAWLFAARATLGVAQGMLSGAATAALAELVPAGHARRAALLATLSQAGGTAAGVLLCGVLAQWAPAPEVTPFAAGMIICALTAAALMFVPETARRQGGALRIRRPRVPAEIRGAFARVSLTAAAVWAVIAALFLAVMPSYAGQLVLHTRNLALLAVVTALVLAASCAAQLAVRRGAPPALAQAAGLALLAAGMLALVLAAPAHSAALLVTGAVLAGAGHGVAFLAAQDDLTRIAPARQRAEVSAAFYVCIYLGVSVPVIGIGLLAVATTLFTAVTTFAAVTGAGALLIAVWHLRNRASTPSRATPDRDRTRHPVPTSR
jgi:predicted MFS family arabinose efflux permease